MLIVTDHCHSLSFRSVIEEYDASMTISTPEHRPHTSSSRNSSSRSSSPNHSSSTVAFVQIDSIAYRSSLRLAQERVRLALKCNLVGFTNIRHFFYNLTHHELVQICHFDAHISSFSSGRISNISAKRDYDRMLSLHFLLDKLDTCATRAKCAKSRMSCSDGIHVAQMYAKSICKLVWPLCDNKSFQVSGRRFWR
jgi:hypothetical protein